MNNFTHHSPQSTEVPRRLSDLEETPHSPEKTFGRKAVESANRQAIHLEHMSTYDEESDQYIKAEQNAHYYGEEALRHVADVRTSLRSLNASAGGAVGAYFDVSVPLHLMNQLRPEAAHAEYISDKNSAAEVMQGLKELPDDVLLNVLQWHNHVIEQQSESEEVQRSFRVLKYEFLIAANKIYERGFFALPPKDIDDAALVVGDVFDTLAKERSGYYRFGETEVTVGQGMGISPEDRIDNFRAEFPRVLIHEFVHLFLNRSLEDRSNPVTARWINEALTEQVARNIRKEMGRFDEKDTTYAAERRLLRLVISRSPNQVETTKLATRAFSGTEADRDAFVGHINKVWNATDVLEKIEDALLKEEARQVSELRINEPTREIERSALVKVYDQLKENPQSILWATGDFVLENEGKVAQEK